MGRVVRNALMLAILILVACDDADNPYSLRDQEIFQLEIDGEYFHVGVVDEGVAATLAAFLESGEPVPVVTGELRSGDAGVNSPYDWHLDPQTVEVVDAAMELCDGRPSLVQEELDYWLETVKRYCPWGPTVVERVVVD